MLAINRTVIWHGWNESTLEVIDYLKLILPFDPKLFVISPAPQDVQQSNWYVGEHSRQAVEEALRRENKVTPAGKPTSLCLLPSYGLLTLL